MKSQVCDKNIIVYAGKITTLLINTYIIISYLFCTTLSFKAMWIFMLFGILGVLQIGFHKDVFTPRSLLLISMEAILIVVLYVLVVIQVPQVVLLFLPLIFWCGRILPLKYSLVALTALFFLALIAGHVANVPRDISFVVLNPSLLLAYFPGWIIRQERNNSIQMQKMLERIHKQQSELEKAHIELIKYTMDAEEHAVIKERSRMAGEIHDTIGHSLTSIIRGLDACRELIHNKPDEANSFLLAIRSIAKEGLEDIRRSVRSGQDMEKWFLDKDWHSILERFAHQVTQGTGISLRILTPIEIPINTRYAAFQCMKEAVTNAIRHGHATDISFIQRDTPSQFIVEITNNGLVPQLPLTHGVGLCQMSTRMQNTGGKVEYTVNNNTFQIALSWPKDVRREVSTG